MTLIPGSRLGPYEVLSALGAGGMGEVYRARDSRLGRDVALKILPALFAADPDRLARFGREAQALAALNHPYIAQIYGLEDGPPTGGAEAPRALVMELVDGDTLAELIARGPIAPADALATARQIAEALEAAHEQGIVHRDLKPANIKVTPAGTVKVLDFGLAKLTAADGGAAHSSHALSMSPTLTSPMTGVGVLLGTAAYMPPEQARGRMADRRADIWAFGCVLYEMLTGRRAFDGSDVTDVLASVLRAEPDWTLLPRGLPPAVRPVLERCLQKDPAQRARDIADVRLALDGAFTPAVAPAVERAGRVRPLALAVGLAAAIGAAVLGYTAARSTAEPVAPPAAVRFELGAPAGTSFQSVVSAPFPSTAPDGRLVAFIVNAPQSPPMIAVRALGRVDTQILAGTERATDPFWSPDGRAIGFFADGKLKIVNVAGGLPRIISDASSALGGTWNAAGTIVFAARGETGTGLWRVSAAGGARAPLSLSVEGDVAWPWFLPDGEHFLYVAVSSTTVRAGALSSSDDQAVTQAGSKAMYADGYLLFLRLGTLFAQPFDPRTRTLSGEPAAIVDGVGFNPANARAAFSVGGGVLAYRVASAETAHQQFRWLARNGRPQSDVGAPGAYASFDLSNDDRFIVATRSEPSGAAAWILDVARGTATRATTSGRPASDPVWSPDGRRFAYRARGVTVVEQAAFGGAERVVGDVDGLFGTEDWSRDGRYLAVELAGGRGAIVPVDGGPPIVFAEVGTTIDEPHFAPDGSLIAFNADDSGRHEIYLAPLPATRERWPVSSGGGVQPKWRADGQELFYLAPDGTLMAVAIGKGSPPVIGIPKALFKSGVEPTFNQDQYAVNRDGQRFLFRVPAEGTTSAPPMLTVASGWTSLLSGSR